MLLAVTNDQVGVTNYSATASSTTLLDLSNVTSLASDRIVAESEVNGLPYRFEVFGDFSVDDPENVSGDVVAIRIGVSENDGLSYSGLYWLNPSEGYTWEDLQSLTISDAFFGNDLIEGGKLNDKLYGYAGNDRLYGGAGNDILNGGGSNDFLVGGGGNDNVNGGSGIDSISYQGAQSAVSVDLNLTTAQNTGGQGTDTLAALENITGSAFNDTLYGDEFVNVMRGGHGTDNMNGRAEDDQLDGQGGNDTVNGSTGNDELEGGGGNDIFLFNSALNASTNVDTIKDFESNDTIRLDNDIFTGITFLGAPTSGAFFRANATGMAGDSTDRIVYDTATGDLYYDADGNGAGGRILFATLEDQPTLAYQDFLITD